MEADGHDLAEGGGFRLRAAGCAMGATDATDRLYWNAEHQIQQTGRFAVLMVRSAMSADYFDWLFSEEGQREHKRELNRLAKWQREQWHAARFRRAADRHDRRIPFETRVAVLERADEHCEHCGELFPTEFTPCLELHHLTYDRAYGHELPDDLMALCRDCHQRMHADA